MIDSLGHKALSGAIWASIDKFGSMGMQFGVNLVLARLLLPSDFGIIGMLMIFIAVSQVLLDGGFSTALIQKKNPTQADYSTIFYWNLIFSTFLYLLLYLGAPLISKFYAMPLLSNVLRVIALSLIITGIIAVQKTRLQKNLAFKTIAIVNLSSYFSAALIAIGLAYNDYGVWSLVAMQLGYGIFSTILFSIITRWHPNLIFSKTSFKTLFGFGGYIMASNILQSICQNIQGIIIGKRFSATQMGYYSQAYKLDQITSYSIPQVIVQVMFPVYSSIQDDRTKLNNMVLMNMQVIAFIIFPILSILILIANPLISFLYGEKWIPAVPYFRILCVGGFFVCLQNINYYAVAAVGKSKSLFKWSFYKWGFLLGALLIGMNFGMTGILWGMVLSNINIFLVNGYLLQTSTHLMLWHQLKCLIPIVTALTVSFFIGFLVLHYTQVVLLSALIILLTFITFSIIFKLKSYKETKKLIENLLSYK